MNAPRPDGWDNAHLLTGCLEHRQGAWEEFHRRFASLVYGTIQWTLKRHGRPRHAQLAEEIFQDFFRHLIENRILERLDKPESLKSYLSSVAVSRSIDALRTSGRRQANANLTAGGDGEEADAGSLASPGPNPRETAALNEMIEWIGAELEALPWKERFILRMNFEQDLTHREISDLTGIPMNTVSSLVRRTKEKLKERLLEKGFSDENDEAP